MVFHMSRAARGRVFPCLMFMLLLALRGWLPPEGLWGIDPLWVYGLSVLVVGGMLIVWRKEYGELARQTLPDAHEAAWAVAVGLAVFGLWIHLDAPWMTVGEPTAAFRPLNVDGSIDPLLVAMRWIQRPGFVTVDPAQVGLRTVVISTFLFVLVHPLWLAAALAGLAYAWLYIRSGKLWSCVIAHAVTNGALGIWVVYSGQWQFW
jgi:hypothetical protein